MSDLFSRRNLLSLGVVGTGALAAKVALQPATSAGSGTVSTVVPAAAVTTPHGHHAGPGLLLRTSGDTSTSAAAAVAPFSVELPIPPVLAPTRTTADTDYYELIAKPGQENLLPGVSTTVFGYGGSYVGPTIRTRVGRQAVVRYTNQLTVPTNVHLHGGHTPADSDGFPTDLVAPGASRDYTYPNQQDSATLWYHEHSHTNSSEYIYRGLHAFYLLEDSREDALGLPSGSADIPLLLSDAHFDDNGQLIYFTGDELGRSTLLTNGRPAPFLKVEPRRYRFRILNASNMRVFELVLGENEQFVQIAGDGGLLPAPANVRSVLLTPGERAEIVIDFSRHRPGTQLVLTDTRNLIDPASPVSLPVLRFDVGQAAASSSVDPSRIPATLRPLPALPPAAQVREIVLAYNPVNYPFTINGKLFDEHRVDTTVKRGTSEIWRITNSAQPLAVYHNLHLHLVQFRVLDRNGRPPAPAEAGYKDTVLLAPGETVRIQAVFASYTGKYLYHCHVEDHAAAGMMAVFETVA